MIPYIPAKHSDDKFKLFEMQSAYKKGVSMTVFVRSTVNKEQASKTPYFYFVEGKGETNHLPESK